MNDFFQDIITVKIDNKTCIERDNNSSLLVIHTIFIPMQALDHLKQDNTLSLRKFTGEVCLEEPKTCLVWYYQTLIIRVLLPTEKYKSWIKDAKDVLSSTKVTTYNLVSMIEKKSCRKRHTTSKVFTHKATPLTQ